MRSGFGADLVAIKPRKMRSLNIENKNKVGSLRKKSQSENSPAARNEGDSIKSRESC